MRHAIRDDLIQALKMTLIDVQFGQIQIVAPIIAVLPFELLLESQNWIHIVQASDLKRNNR
jgi:hypothetical protein